MSARFLIAPSLCLLLALAGCAAPVSSVPVPSSTVSAPGTVSPAPSAEAARPTPEDPEESRLLSLLEESAGRAMTQHLYLDLDRDSAAELLGVCLNTDTHLYEVWYCSSDGQTRALVEQDAEEMESCSLEPLALDGETHVAVNRHLGTNTARFSILALQEGGIRCLVSWQPGMVAMTEAGDIQVTAYAHDAAYDPAVEGLIGLGEKRSYLFYRDGAYGECGATELTEAEFSALENASELMSAIEHELRFEDMERMECRYFLRANGILQVQCDLYDAYGGVEYGYFAARCQNGTVDPALLGRFVNGQLESTLTTLETAY